MNEYLEMPNNNINRPLKQNSIQKIIELPKLGQTIKCKLTNDTDSGWRKLNVISRAGKATGKNKDLKDVVMEQGWILSKEYQSGK